MQLLYKLAAPAGARNRTSRARIAITAFFTMDGFVFASWAVRIPAVKAAVGASPQTLGIALLGVSAGAIATMALTGALCRRLGSARVTVLAGLWVSLALLLPSLARSAPALGLGLAVFGIGYGGLNVAMNSLAVDLVAVVGRPIMPSFHAAWSLGGLAGAALGGLAAPALTPLAHFSFVCAGGLAVTAISGWVILTTPLPVAYAAPTGRSGHSGKGERAGQVRQAGHFWHSWHSWRGRKAGHSGQIGGRPGGSGGDGSEGGISEGGISEGGIGPAAEPMTETRGGVWHPAATKRRSGVWRTVLLLGVIALCSTYGEGAVSDWGALHLRDDLGAAAGLAAAGYAAFALAEACGRLAGTALLAWLGQTRVLVGGSLATCVGMIAAALAPTLPLALAGFALAGLGVANAFPTAMARVGLLAGPNGVSAASTLGYAGFLLGPPAIGFLATAVSLRVALTTVSLLAIIAAILARSASPTPHT